MRAQMMALTTKAAKAEATTDSLGQPSLSMSFFAKCRRRGLSDRARRCP